MGWSNLYVIISQEQKQTLLDERSKLLEALEREHQIISTQKAKIFVRQRLGNEADVDDDADANDAGRGTVQRRNQVRHLYSNVF